MKIIRTFVQLLGFIFIGLIVHEIYHVMFADKVSKACYVVGKGFAVYSTGTSEVIPYVLMIGIFILGIIWTYKYEYR